MAAVDAGTLTAKRCEVRHVLVKGERSMYEYQAVTTVHPKRSNALDDGLWAHSWCRERQHLAPELVSQKM